jgi:hypothetical protein
VQTIFCITDARSSFSVSRVILSSSKVISLICVSKYFLADSPLLLNIICTEIVASTLKEGQG